MSISPLDMQINLAQMDAVGKNYMRLYNAPRHDQHYHATHFEQRSRDIDTKVLDLPEELSDYQQVDPDGQNKRSKKDLHKYPYKNPEEQSPDDPYQEFDKGNFIDVKR